jgi:hypothetical protein
MKDDARLNEIAQRLGARAAQRLDVEATARKVVERLRDEPAQRPTWIQPTWLRIAAALVIVVGGAFTLRQVWPGSESGAHVAHFVADDLSDLSTDQLRDVLALMDEIVVSDSVAVPESNTDLRELDAQQLRAVLRSLEG